MIKSGFVTYCLAELLVTSISILHSVRNTPLSSTSLLSWRGNWYTMSSCNSQSGNTLVVLRYCKSDIYVKHRKQTLGKSMLGSQWSIPWKSMESSREVNWVFQGSQWSLAGKQIFQRIKQQFPSSFYMSIKTEFFFHLWESLQTQEHLPCWTRILTCCPVTGRVQHEVASVERDWRKGWPPRVMPSIRYGHLAEAWAGEQVPGAGVGLD